jgi:hypothetical protein
MDKAIEIGLKLADKAIEMAAQVDQGAVAELRKSRAQLEVLAQKPVRKPKGT